MLNRLIANLQNASIRYESLEGRDYLVVPTVMMTEGVHNGTQGPLYYPGEQLSKFPESWNYKPVVAYHPMDAKSATTVHTLEKQRVGILLNTKYDGRLVTETWLDIEKANKVDSRIIDNVENGIMTEVSTGVYTENEMTAGTINGEDYVGTALNYRADHLAILPDQVGACSIADGAGLLRNQETSHNEIRDQLHALVAGKAPRDGFVYVEAVYDSYFIYEITAPNEPPMLFKQGYGAVDGVVSLTEAPRVEVKRVQEYRTVDGDSLVANMKPRRNFIDESGDMKKKELVDKLIANTEFGEGDRVWLQNQSERHLGILVQNATADDEEEEQDDDDDDGDDEPAASKKPARRKAETPNPPAPEQPEPELEPVAMNVDQYVQNAPPEIRDVLQLGIETAGKQRKEFVDTIVANANNPFTRETLEGKPLSELSGLAALAKQPEQQPAPGSALQNALGARFNFAGQSAPTGNTASKSTPLAVPGYGYFDAPKTN